MYQAGTPFTVDTTPNGARVDYPIAVAKSGRYVLEVDGASTLVGLRAHNGVGLLRVCGSAVKGTHANTPTGQLIIEVDGKEGGQVTINLRPWVFSDYAWSNFLWTRYKSTC